LSAKSQRRTSRWPNGSRRMIPRSSTS
jgi:hypothetical protein